MFCQIPFLELKQALKKRSFFKALLFGNFVLIPLIVWILTNVFPTTPIITLGVLLVLLTPCIDYVIIFSHLGKGDSKAVLASTPLLFIFQMLLLPLYLWIFIGKETIAIIEIAPFAKAFLYLIVIPFSLSIVTQILSKSNKKTGKAILDFSGWLPVPLMALTFFVVIASQIRDLYDNIEPILKVIPIYVAFAIIAPFIGKLSAKIFKVDFYGSRAISFSTSTRNSLVVLPLALSLPAPENQLVAIVIVTQTIVEIFFELIYIKAIPILTKENKN
ncbi:MAG: arsenic resistance protein [Flavobacteriales bacterium 32-34-25]|nr:MAG: arsenic resistance protein [Flavobacteriales bacterium 32-34-25]